MEFDPENPLTNPIDDHVVTLHSLFYLESDHIVSDNYVKNLKTVDFHVTLRRQAVSIISQITGRFDPFVSYLAINYLDRFLSIREMPQPKTWVVRLLGTACVSLAAKMMKTEFNISNLQCGEGLIFDTQTIERMEQIILGVLQWRVRPITPLAFLEFFIDQFKLEDPPLRQALKARATEIIFIAQNDIELLEYKPSIVAASAVLSASHELFPIQFPSFRISVSSCSLVNKEDISNCSNAINEILEHRYESVFTAGGGCNPSSDTLDNVLDQNWSSCSTTTCTTIAGAITSSEHSSFAEPEGNNKPGRIRSRG
ncbi:hypothetical protein Droror1_Dr00003083 [Drosera rotundifolia]